MFTPAHNRELPVANDEGFQGVTAAMAALTPEPLHCCAALTSEALRFGVVTALPVASAAALPKTNAFSAVAFGADRFRLLLSPEVSTFLLPRQRLLHPCTGIAFKLSSATSGMSASPPTAGCTSAV